LGRLDGLTDLWQIPAEFAVTGMLEEQAAHKPVAKAAEFGWVQGDALVLGGTDADRLEGLEELGTAERPPARPEAAKHTGVVAHTYLSQLNAAVEAVS
jgi:hypothetical protein